MTDQQSVMVFTDLGLVDELKDRDFRNHFFRTEREIDIPAQIKSLRKFRGLNQAQLAELVGTKQSAISRFEKSQDANWELETLVRMAEALDARLSVVIEPYEQVISRYQQEASASTASAVTAQIDLRQQAETPSVLSAESRNAKQSDPNGTGGNRIQQGNIFDSADKASRSALYP